MLRKYKKPQIQLTSLLDLLFVMIFVSIVQSKEIPPETKEKIKEKVKEQTTSVPTPKLKKIAVKAIFSFYPTANNPAIPQGSYRAEGVFDEKSGSLHLGGVDWINRPPGYEMVPLRGKIDKERLRFEGVIEFPDCEKFILLRSNSKSTSVLGGEWKGSYTCFQGETGLTLIFE